MDVTLYLFEINIESNMLSTELTDYDETRLRIQTFVLQTKNGIHKQNVYV